VTVYKKFPATGLQHNIPDNPLLPMLLIMWLNVERYQCTQLQIGPPAIKCSEALSHAML